MISLFYFHFFIFLFYILFLFLDVWTFLLFSAHVWDQVSFLTILLHAIIKYGMGHNKGLPFFHNGAQLKSVWGKTDYYHQLLVDSKDLSRLNRHHLAREVDWIQPPMTLTNQWIKTYQ